MEDRYLEIFKEFSTFQVAYIEGLTFPMDKEINPLMKGMKIVGRAFTVNEKHAVCMNIFQEIKEGEILVVRGKDPTHHGGCGAMVCEWLKERGSVGVVIDGGAQDTANIRKTGFPVFCRYVVSTHGDTKWKGEIQVPIECGGVHVRPGDLIIGDDDGIVVIPRGNEEKVIQAIRLLNEALRYVEKELRRGKKLWEVEGIKEMWLKKEEMGKYQWEVYKEWNKKYIKEASK